MYYDKEQYDNSVVHDVKPYVIDDFHLAKQHSSGCVAHDATKQSLASNPQRLTETPVNICQQSSKSERWEQQEEATKPSIFSQKNSSGQVVNQNAIFKSDIENIPVVPPTSISVALTDKFVEVVETVEAERKKANAQSENHVPFIVVTLLRQSPHMVLKGDLTEVEIIHLPNIPGVGLGFGIVGGTSTGVVVKTILPGSTADKDKRLRPGDHILRIRGISVYGMSSQQVATLLRQQYTMIEIVVGRPAFTSNQSTNDTACKLNSQLILTNDIMNLKNGSVNKN
ncbi:unnamed protein product [Thelazia callipaeda]|uniref:PDZ domain-containing protein n=1 Tax=Thelazia callipaeda TaxID=103827 RepID=A0A0N5CY99_THECL|nr:unnamed protein product [Thelazia callipaeda]